MTDGVDLLLNATPRVVGRTVLGAPPSVYGRRRFHAATPPPRSALRCVSAAVDRLRTFGVTACNRVIHGAPGHVHQPTYHIPRAQPAHHLGGRPTSSIHPRRAGVEARPYGRWLRGMTDCVIASHPRCTNPSVTPLRAATAPLSGEPRGGRRFAAFAHLFTTMLIPTFSCRP